jgi:hypothetical protein
MFDLRRPVCRVRGLRYSNPTTYVVSIILIHSTRVTTGVRVQWTMIHVTRFAPVDFMEYYWCRGDSFVLFNNESMTKKLAAFVIITT